jgi:hypothetical protein
MSHFPMYLNVPAFGSDKPADPGTGALSDEAWFASEQCEYEGHNKNCTSWTEEEKRVRQKQARAEAKYGTGISPSANADLEPIFYEYGVDIYWAGHIHFCKCWPPLCVSDMHFRLRPLSHPPIRLPIFRCELHLALQLLQTTASTARSTRARCSRRAPTTRWARSTAARATAVGTSRAHAQRRIAPLSSAQLTRACSLG